MPRLFRWRLISSLGELKEWQKWWNDDLSRSIGRGGDLPDSEIYYESGRIRLRVWEFDIKEYREDGQAKARASDLPECIESYMSVEDWWLEHRGNYPCCKEHEWSK